MKKSTKAAKKTKKSLTVSGHLKVRTNIKAGARVV